MPCITPGCSRPLGTGGAKGMCPRCYRWQSRHPGETVPTEPQRAADGEGERVSVRLPASLLKATEAAARRAGEKVPEWVREAIRQRLARGK